MTLATTCPQCKTSFKVLPEQLKRSKGMVRCGVCRHAFSGLEYLRYLEAPRQQEVAQPEVRVVRETYDEVAGPVTLMVTDYEIEQQTAAIDRDMQKMLGRISQVGAGNRPGQTPVRDIARASAPFAAAIADAAVKDPEGRAAGAPAPRPNSPQPPNVPHPGAAKARSDAPHKGADAPNRPRTARADRAEPALYSERLDLDWSDPRGAAIKASQSAQHADADEPEAVDFFARPRQSNSAHRQLADFAQRALIGVLALAAVLQLALVMRDGLADVQPSWRPALSTLAGWFGLNVERPRRLAQLTIEGVDLQSDASPDTLSLSAVLRNTGHSTLQWPALELGLTDAAGALVIRKVIMPDDYLSADRNSVDAGIAGGNEQPIRLVLKIPPSSTTNYAVSLFYP